MTAARAMLPAGVIARRLPIAPLAASSLASTTALALHATQVDGAVDLIPTTHAIGVVIAASAAGCLDDPSEPLSDATPFGRPRRRWITMGATALLATAGWSLAVLAGSAAVDGDLAGVLDLPVGGLVVELVALVAVGWLIAAVLVARGSRRGSHGRAGLMLVMVTALSLVHPRVMTALWVPRDGRRDWWDVQGCWALAGVAALGAVAVFSSDPAGRFASARHRGGLP